MAQVVKAEFEHVQILCNNAGTVLGVPNAVHTYDEDAWMRTIDVNLHGVYRVSKAIVPLMLDTGGGTVINMASRAAKVPPLFNGAYAVAKAGVVMLTKVMARELAGSGIRVNAVCPGVIDTDLQNGVSNWKPRFLIQLKKTAKRKWFKPFPWAAWDHPLKWPIWLPSWHPINLHTQPGRRLMLPGDNLMEL